MRHCRIIFLLLSSLFFSSCTYKKVAAYQKKSSYTFSSEELPPFDHLEKALKYKASIDVLNKHFSGLVVIKQTDSETKHLVFVTELGMSMFDFVVKGDSMKPVFVFDALNKPRMVNALVRNFETIVFVKWFNKSLELREKSGRQTVYLRDGDHERFFIKDQPIKLYHEQLVFYKHKKETRTLYSLNYDHIKLKQYGLVKLYIELDKIKE